MIAWSEMNCQKLKAEFATFGPPEGLGFGPSGPETWLIWAPCSFGTSCLDPSLQNLRQTSISTFGSAPFTSSGALRAPPSEERTRPGVTSPGGRTAWRRQRVRTGKSPPGPFGDPLGPRRGPFAPRRGPFGARMKIATPREEQHVGMPCAPWRCDPCRPVLSWLPPWRVLADSLAPPGDQKWTLAGKFPPGPFGV